MDFVGAWLERRRIAAVLPHARGRLLDIGCGANHLVRGYGNGVGVDVYDWGDVDCLVEDSASLPFPDKTFGTISILAALNHIPNREAVLKECHRLLMDGGGRLIITMIPPFISSVWHHIRFPWDADQKERGMKAGEVYGMTREQINALCVRAGFVLAHAEKFMMGLNSLYVFHKSG